MFDHYSAIAWLVCSRQTPQLVAFVSVCFTRETDFRMLLQFISLLSELGTHRVSDLVSQHVDRFAPLFVGDHMVAL